MNKTSIMKSPERNTDKIPSNNTKIIKEKKVSKRGSLMSVNSLNSQSVNVNKTAIIIRKDNSKLDTKPNVEAKQGKNTKNKSGIIKRVKEQILVNNNKRESKIKESKLKNGNENEKLSRSENIRDASPNNPTKKTKIDLSNAPKIFSHFINKNSNPVNTTSTKSPEQRVMETQETKTEIMQIISNMNGSLRHGMSCHSASASLPKELLTNMSKNKEEKKEDNLSSELSIINFMNYKREEEKKEVFIRNKYKTLLEDYLIRNEY